MGWAGPSGSGNTGCRVELRSPWRKPWGDVTRTAPAGEAPAWALPGAGSDRNCRALPGSPPPVDARRSLHVRRVSYHPAVHVSTTPEPVRDEDDRARWRAAHEYYLHCAA